MRSTWIEIIIFTFRLSPFSSVSLTTHQLKYKETDKNVTYLNIDDSWNNRIWRLAECFDFFTIFLSSSYIFF